LYKLFGFKPLLSRFFLLLGFLGFILIPDLLALCFSFFSIIVSSFSFKALSANEASFSALRFLAFSLILAISRSSSSRIELMLVSASYSAIRLSASSLALAICSRCFFSSFSSFFRFFSASLARFSAAFFCSSVTTFCFLFSVVALLKRLLVLVFWEYLPRHL
jgi:hypothetical protein